MTLVERLPATIASRYLPVRQIGRGGMGVVYEVVHALTGEHLALKVLLASGGAPVVDLHRFKQEARAPAKIKSENVVRVLDADTAPELHDAPFLVMELLDGLDLEQAATASPPSPQTVVEWLRQVAGALDKAHRIGIIHRDLKPENLFLANQEGRPPIVKILDFGIAKITEDGSTATASGQVLGTPRYMAPEQATQDSKVTGAADLYALGLVAYRLLVGESYYSGPVMGVLAELLHGVKSMPSARHPHVGATFDAWFLRACHRDPASRFVSASQQVEALAAALGLPIAPAVGEQIHSLAPAPRPRPWSRHQLVLLAGAGVLLMAAASAYRILSSPETAALQAAPDPLAPVLPRVEALQGAASPPPVAVPPAVVETPVAQPAVTQPATLLAPKEPGPPQKPVRALVLPPSATAKPRVPTDPYQDQK